MAAYFFASPVDVDIRLNDEDKRKQVELKLEKERRESCPVFYDGESVVGQVNSLLPATLYAHLSGTRVYHAAPDSCANSAAPNMTLTRPGLSM